MKRSLVHPKERFYFALCALISVVIYAVAVWYSQIGLVYLLGGFGVLFFLHGLGMGAIRGNGIRVSEQQFPEVHRLTSELAGQMGFRQVPAVYVLQAGGELNAFATSFLLRNFVIIYSDILELAYDKGEDELAFVVSHELGHLARRHILKHWLVLPATFIPFLGNAYSRACEYTCDRYGAHYRPAGAVGGLLVLSAGKRLYRQVDAGQFRAQTRSDRGFWVWLAEVLSTHPRLPKRVAAVEAIRQPLP